VNRANFERALAEDLARNPQNDPDFEAGSKSTALSMPSNAYTEDEEMRAFAKMSGGGAASGGPASGGPASGGPASGGTAAGARPLRDRTTSNCGFAFCKSFFDFFDSTGSRTESDFRKPCRKLPTSLLLCLCLWLCPSQCLTPATPSGGVKKCARSRAYEEAAPPPDGQHSQRGTQVPKSPTV
jgi:hypothetical protein